MYNNQNNKIKIKTEEFIQFMVENTKTELITTLNNLYGVKYYVAYYLLLPILIISFIFFMKCVIKHFFINFFNTLCNYIPSLNNKRLILLKEECIQTKKKLKTLTQLLEGVARSFKKEAIVTFNKELIDLKQILTILNFRMEENYSQIDKKIQNIAKNTITKEEYERLALVNKIIISQYNKYMLKLFTLIVDHHSLAQLALHSCYGKLFFTVSAFSDFRFLSAIKYLWLFPQTRDEELMEKLISKEVISKALSGRSSTVNSLNNFTKINKYDEAITKTYTIPTLEVVDEDIFIIRARNFVNYCALNPILKNNDYDERFATHSSNLVVSLHAMNIWKKKFNTFKEELLTFNKTLEQILESSDIDTLENFVNSNCKQSENYMLSTSDFVKLNTKNQENWMRDSGYSLGSYEKSEWNKTYLVDAQVNSFYTSSLL